ncbi:uncharacterized protein B0T15DRAFT_575316 [Chaetomium strumarium]|uniref:Uncharacterized protein n=1 Tax=Chaetomium strumarium TaxID=1170767 RepID=A0AAJ0GU04_9PEZI|nr:hypothetical protein B0T15DRAFT_575316 [Chaetomium strumarium]
MRLLHPTALELRQFHSSSDCPPYAILSHTWGPEEVTFQEITSPERAQKLSTMAPSRPIAASDYSEVLWSAYEEDIVVLSTWGRWEDSQALELCSRPPEESLNYPTTIAPKRDQMRDGTSEPEPCERGCGSPPTAKSWEARWFEAPGSLNGIPVRALPDSGSSINAISEEFARRHGFDIIPGGVPIDLLGKRKAEIIGRVTADFQFRGERQVFRREFYVLRESLCKVVLGGAFLRETGTTGLSSGRIVERVRPLLRSGNRFCLLHESPQDHHIRCSVNGSAASAFPDTGSDLMLVSGNFARRNGFKIHSEDRYRRELVPIDGSSIWTDGMVLNARLELDIPPSSRPSMEYDAYLDLVAGMSYADRATGGLDRTTFICDLHLVEDLPCDIILSGEFVFQHHVLDRFKSPFSASPLPPTPSTPLASSGTTAIRRQRHQFNSSAAERTMGNTMESGRGPEEPSLLVDITIAGVPETIGASQGGQQTGYMGQREPTAAAH